MNTSLLARANLVQSAISKTTEACGKRFSSRSFPPFLARGLPLGILVAIAVYSANASATDEGKIVAALDTQYQAAVQRTMRSRWIAFWLTISY